MNLEKQKIPIFTVFMKWHKFVHLDATPDHNYLVTAVGCGIAGYTPEDVAPMFMEAASLPNVFLPQCFWTILDKYIKVV